MIEVSSPSTQGCDRSAKFASYRRLPSLREYALIDPDSRRIEVFRPEDDGHWKLFDTSDGYLLTFISAGAQIALLAVFNGMSHQ